MWGTDGIRIQTVEEGGVWLFSAVDHFDACCVGIHPVKVGNRFAAMQPIVQGLPAELGATGAHAGKGLKLRRDHGTQDIANDFLKQIEFRASTRALPSWLNRRPTAWSSASTGR
ncbi:MAG: hypothetical protein JNK99_12065 [Candidatus Accumulibacter sp.]|mgnify:CR=1 FL=1|uniref:hypothetical protein n=1 Tax=Accumulibacter sp. TaxID=2053492 RepID=UPI001A5A3619|nr:hypothetical protein [Accumulibacter sp.]MBL8395461.1 hypothetical protein [Accumulibacter sp.]